MNFSGVTAFQKDVYKAVLRVPEGFVTSYASIAEYVGCGSARAVGQALKPNPFAPEVPCHRVISSDLTIGGFRGSRSGKRIGVKLHMLAREGVIFDKSGKLRDTDRLLSSEDLSKIVR